MDCLFRRQAVEAAHKVMIKDKCVEVKLAIPREEMQQTVQSNGVLSELQNRAIRPRAAAYTDEASAALALYHQFNPTAHLNQYLMTPRAVASDAFLPRYPLPLGLDLASLHAGGAGGGLIGLESQIAPPAQAFGSLAELAGPDVRGILGRSQGPAWGFADF